MTRPASLATLQALAEAFDKWARHLSFIHGSSVTDEHRAVADALAAYRAEVGPPLRTRAEVDAQIAATIRKDRLASRGLGMANSTLYALDNLCAERTREPEAGPWRVGTKVPRNLYENDRDVGRMDTPELAARVVAVMNRDRS